MYRIANHLQPDDLKMQKALRRQEAKIAAPEEATQDVDKGDVVFVPRRENVAQMAQLEHPIDAQQELPPPGRDIRRRI